MPLNLYNYHTAKLAGDDYQSDIPLIVFQRLRNQGPYHNQKNKEQQQLIAKYKDTILKDPDIAADFAARYMDIPLYGREEKFIADNATDLSNLITYMRKFGVNNYMQDRIMRGHISDRMKYATQIIKSPLDPKFNKEILKASNIDLAMYAADFDKARGHNASPASFWKQVHERILTDITATAIYMGIAKQRWHEGEELLMQAYAKDRAQGPLVKWAIGHIDELKLRMNQIDNKREHQN